ncbi:MAG: hypothetical protein AAGN35_17200 [Bacteroidota bacterium]
MEFKRLYHFVHGLSSQERRIFSIYIGSKKNTRPYRLYKAILKHPQFDSKSSESIRGDVFRESHQFIQDRERLAQWIISSIIHSEEGLVPAISFIRKSYICGAEGIARRALLDEFRKQNRSYRYDKLARLHELTLELRNVHGIEATLPNDVEISKQSLDAKYVFMINQYERQLHQMIADLRLVRHKEDFQRKRMVIAVQSRLHSDYPTDYLKCLALKVRMNCAYYQGDFKLSFEYGRQLIPRLFEIPKAFSSNMLAQEIRFVALISLLNANRDLAIGYAMKMAEINVEGAKDVSRIAISRLMLYTTIASSFGEIQLAESALADLNQYFEEVPNLIACKLYFHLGQAFFYNERYQVAARCFHASRNLVKKDTPFLQWEPSLHLAICYHKMGDVDLVESMLASAKVKVKQHQRRFPKECYHIVNKYLLHQPQTLFILDELHQSLERINELLNDPEEKRASHWFAIRSWIHSKVTSKPQKELLHAFLTPELMKDCLFLAH